MQPSWGRGCYVTIGSRWGCTGTAQQTVHSDWSDFYHLKLVLWSSYGIIHMGNQQTDFICISMIVLSWSPSQCVYMCSVYSGYNHFQVMFCICKSHILVLWKLCMLITVLLSNLNILWRVITIYWILKIWNRGGKCWEVKKQESAGPGCCHQVRENVC